MAIIKAKTWPKYIEYEIKLVNLTNLLSNLNRLGLRPVKHGMRPANAIAESEK